MDIIPTNFWGQLFGCIWCLSLWVSLLLYVFYVLAPMLALFFMAFLAAGTVAVLANKSISE